MHSSMVMFICGLIIGLVIGVLVCDLGFSGWDDRYSPRDTNTQYEQLQQRKDFDHDRRMREQSYTTDRKEPC